GGPAAVDEVEYWSVERWMSKTLGLDGFSPTINRSGRQMARRTDPIRDVRPIARRWMFERILRRHRRDGSAPKPSGTPGIRGVARRRATRETLRPQSTGEGQSICRRRYRGCGGPPCRERAGWEPSQSSCLTYLLWSQYRCP